jgi:glycosyl hydrolase family 42 (putative beta-galactosidase)
LSTSSGAAPADLRGIWQAWLTGSRGLILWDEQGDIVDRNGAPTERGRAYASVFRVLRGDLGSLVAASRKAYDPVAILYSPASFRIQWMIEHQSRGNAWMLGSSEADAQGNAERESMRQYASTLATLGLQPRFITPEQLAQGDLGAPRVLILPHTVAMGEREVQNVRAFAATGGLVLADTMAGEFDQHGRPRAGTPLADLFASDHAQMVRPDDASSLRSTLARAQVKAAFVVKAADVRSYVSELGGLTIVGLQQRSATDGRGEPVQLTLPRPMYALDAIARKDLGRVEQLDLNLDPIAPAVVVLSETPLGGCALDLRYCPQASP